jgi:leader peptidase (prepilin peptidase)/N-methyltransferase
MIGRLRDHLPDAFAAISAIVTGFLLLPPLEAGFAAALAVLATIVAAVDRRHLLIPDSANLALAVLGLGLTVLEAGPDETASALAEAIARGLLAGLLFWSLRAGHHVLRGGEGLGLGDVKLAAAGAPWLAWGTLVPVLELAVFGALIVVAIEAIGRRAAPRPDDMVPFGVLLAPALWIGFLAERTGLLDRLTSF